MNPKLHLKSQIEDQVTGEIICGCGCGLVITSKLAERNLPAKDDLKDIHHKNENPLEHDMGLGTVISHTYAQRNTPSLKQKNNINRIRVWQQRTRPSNYHDRRLAYYLTKLGEFETEFNLTPMLKNDIVMYLRKLENQHVLDGKLVTITMTVLTAFVKRMHGIPFNPKESRKKYKFKWSTYNRYFAEFQNALKLETTNVIESNDRILFVIAKKVQCSQKTVNSAKSVIEYCRAKAVYATKQPSILAATCLYVVSINSNERLTLEECAQAASCSEVSIRNLKDEMRDVFYTFKLSTDLRKSIRTYQERYI